MDRPVVSVIIPVYNVQDYIEKAVNSICSQTLTDWEMFLVDDGSTDSSGLLCDNLAANESRIRVIHQDNQGAAAARNAAITLATGKYLYFMDGDDWASEEMLYEMVSLAENYSMDAWAGVPVNNRARNLSSIGRKVQFPSEFAADIPEEMCAQMVITGYYIETYYTETEYYIQKQSVPSAVYGGKNEFRDTAHRLFDRNLLYTVWNKLYLTSYIREKEITFQDVHWDDFPFNMDVIREIERVSVSDQAFYHFIRKRKDSESEKYNPNLYEEREAEHKKLLGLYDGWRCELQQELLEEMKDQQPQISHFDEPELSEIRKVAENVQTIQKEQKQEEPILQGDTGEDEKSGETAAATEDRQETAEEDSSTETAADEEEAAEEAGDKTDASENEQENQEEHTDTASVPEEPEGAPFNFLDKLSPPVPVVHIPSPQASEFISRRYMERIIGCVENITNPACTLSGKEKRAEIKKIINNETVREALKEAQPKSLYMKTMLLPLKMKSPSLTMLEGKFISNVKTKHGKLFARLKANR